MREQRIVIHQNGFTLIEIMMVVAIIGLLAALITPRLFDRYSDALAVRAKSDISQISSQLALYKLSNRSFPSTSQGLAALVRDPGGIKNWRQIADRLPMDPWGNKYQYLYPGSNNSSSYDLWSFGADGAPGGEGDNADIGNWGYERY